MSNVAEVLTSDTPNDTWMLDAFNALGKPAYKGFQSTTGAIENVVGEELAHERKVMYRRARNKLARKQRAVNRKRGA